MRSTPTVLSKRDRGWGQKIILIYGDAESPKFKRGGERLATLLSRNRMDVTVRVVPNGVHGWQSTWNQESIDYALTQIGYWLR